MDDILRVNQNVYKIYLFLILNLSSGGFQSYITWKNNQRASGRDKPCHARVATSKA
jgi:hypothetical protein